MVETSDLLRARGYATLATGRQNSAFRRAAVQASDRLLGEIVARTDPSRDAVLVLVARSSASATQLSVAVLRAPGARRWAPALLDHPTGRLRGAGRRDPDDPGAVRPAPARRHRGPAVRGQLGVGSRSGGAAWCTRAMRPGSATSVLPTTVSLIIVLLVLLLGRRPCWAPDFRTGRGAVLAPAALALLGVVPATFVVGRIATARRGTAPFLLGVAAGRGRGRPPGLAGRAPRSRSGPDRGGRRDRGDVRRSTSVVGAPLQLNTVFGYSVAVAGRFTGLGNLAFALFGASVVVLAALIVDRYPRRGVCPGPSACSGWRSWSRASRCWVPTSAACWPWSRRSGSPRSCSAGRRPRWTHLVGLGGLAVAAVVVLRVRRPGAARGLADPPGPAGATRVRRPVAGLLRHAWVDGFHASFGGADAGLLAGGGRGAPGSPAPTSRSRGPGRGSAWSASDR